MAQSKLANVQSKIARTLALAVSLACTAALPAVAAVPVIPGAAGFGIETPAGRGGTIYRVTNLTDTGTGSLRACMEASGPRVCVFEVSGVIKWSQNVVIRNPQITVAGQTAPSPGIMVRGAVLRIEAPDVLIQHIAFRVGDELEGPSPNSRDAMTINSWGQTATRVVFDHCAFSWNTDEAIGAFHGLGDITISNSIISEGLNFNPVKDNGGFGLLVGPNAGARISVINNLLAHNVERNPMALSGQFVFVNNVVYNWAKEATRISNQVDPQLGGDLVRTKNSFVGNLYVRGPSYGAVPYGPGRPIWFDTTVAGSGNQAYFADNAEVMSTSETPVAPSDQWTLVRISSPNSRSTLEVKSAPTWLAGLAARPVGQVKAHVMANVGPRPADRSAKDAQIVRNLRDGTGTYVSCVNPSSYYSGSGYIAANVANCDGRNAGGWPVYAQNRRALTIPSNPHADDNGNGYTNLEEWLHAMASQVEGRGTLIPPMPPSPVSVQ